MKNIQGDTHCFRDVGCQNKYLFSFVTSQERTIATNKVKILNKLDN